MVYNIIKNMSLNQKIETETKIILTGYDKNKIEDLLAGIEKKYNLIRGEVFHQTTHQFFEDDYTKQIAFPRVRNEESGEVTLTVKAKIKDDNSEYFRRIELESNISNAQDIIAMMPYFGYKNKISWEKKRINLDNLSQKENNFVISLDETPMGYFLEIEADEDRIENIIKELNLQDLQRSNKAYLGIWDDYRKENNILTQDMMF